jgi:hypothetical protein
MFNFFRKSRSDQPPRKLIAQAMVNRGLAPGLDPARLGVVEESGSYSGRQVTYFRVYDPAQVGERSIEIRAYTDLDGHPELILGSGHIEKNGTVVLVHREGSASPTGAFKRSEAVQADHTDDERVMFPDRALE